MEKEVKKEVYQTPLLTRHARLQDLTGSPSKYGEVDEKVVLNAEVFE